MVYPVHPLVLKAVPETSPADYIRLTEGIKNNGLIHPIVLHEGFILDGRTRDRICRAVGVEARYVQYDNQLPVAVYILQTNLRRNLTEAQMDAMIIALAKEVVPAFMAEARELLHKGRQRGTEATKKGSPQKYERSLSDRSNQTQIRFRKLVGKPGKADHAIAVLKHPDLVSKVEAGELSLKEAAHKVKERNGTPVKLEPKLTLPVEAWQKEEEELLAKIKQPSILPPDTMLPAQDDLLRFPVNELVAHQAGIHEMGRTLLWNNIRQHTNALIRKKHLDPKLIAWVTDITLRHQLQERRLSLVERNTPARKRKPEKKATVDPKTAFERRFDEYWTHEEKLLNRFFGLDSLRKAIRKWPARAQQFLEEKLSELSPQLNSQDGEDPASSPNGVGN